jgi:biopolymer transport protein ExbD
MSEINVTPLVDVMLVLLIIFMITAPILSHKVRIDLPQPSNNPPQDNPVDPIHLQIKQDGSLYWNDTPVDEAGLKAQIAVVAQQSNQPELQIDADDNAQYEAVARVLSDAKGAGLVKIGFVNTGGGQ